MVRAEDDNSRVQNRIAELVGPKRYKVWFKDTTRFTLADGFLRVGVPNLFIGGWLENHFADTIAKASEEVSGGKVDVTFVIDATLTRSLHRRQLDTQGEYLASNPQRMARERKRSGEPPMPGPLRCRFDDFVVGSSNRLAFSTASAVAEAPATQFNPLFIHGGCGLGKTHLLQGVCNAVQERHPKLRWLYASGEDFTNHFVYSIKNREGDAFRNYYRNVDVLIVDDIHFFANKRATQEEFLHTFNAIDASGKQVVLASDAHPKMIGHLSESLVNRFISGMVVRIDAPEMGLRAEILLRRMAKMKLNIPREVIDYIAANYQVNIRELEGALLKLVAYANVEGRPFDLLTARDALRDHMAKCTPMVRLSDIENQVAIFFGLTPADLHMGRKTRIISLARSIAMHMARRHTNMSYPEIGRFMGDKNHATVIQACRRIESVLNKDGAARWRTPSGFKEIRLSTLIAELESQVTRESGLSCVA